LRRTRWHARAPDGVTESQPSTRVTPSVSHASPNPKPDFMHSGVADTSVCCADPRGCWPSGCVAPRPSETGSRQRLLLSRPRGEVPGGSSRAPPSSLGVRWGAGEKRGGAWLPGVADALPCACAVARWPCARSCTDQSRAQLLARCGPWVGQAAQPHRYEARCSGAVSAASGVMQGACEGARAAR
jgi:hypothetical protein